MQIPYWDIEDIIDEIVTHLKDGTHGINAAVTSINSLKSAKDTAAGRVVIALDKFTDTAGNLTLKENENLFFFMVEEFTNCDPVMAITVPTWETDDMGSNNVTLNFEIIIEDKADGTDPKRKLLRYATALRAVLFDYINVGTLSNVPKLANVAPRFEQVLVDNETRSYYSAGVSVQLIYA